MIRVVLFFLVVFALAFGFSLLADRPGNLEVNWLGYQFQTSMMVAMVAMVTVIASLMIIWWLISSIVHSPQIFSNWRRGRRRDRGYAALSQGLIAAGAGDAANARKLARDSGKLLENEPLVALLDAQTALLEGKRDVARSRFETMLEQPETRMLGLRGLFVEAERHGDHGAAGHFASKAFEIAPSANWAGQAMLRNQSLTNQWEGSLATLETLQSAGGISKEDAKRKKAVLLTARAIDETDSNPDGARGWALAAHKLEPSLVPASVTAANLLGQAGDLRKAAKVLETTWKLEPHPEIAEVYVNLRPGDSTSDRLTRAKALSKIKGNHIEGQIAIAHAAIDAHAWKDARSAMESVLRNSPSERACLLMADIEEAEFGDRGRVRDWLARAVRAPRDAAWTADGQVSDHWAAISPISGKLDAFEWKVPVQQLGGPGAPTDYSEFAHMTAPIEPVKNDNSPVLLAEASKPDLADQAEKTKNDDGFSVVEDAEVVDASSNPPVEQASNVIELDVANSAKQPEPAPAELDKTTKSKSNPSSEAPKVSSDKTAESKSADTKAAPDEVDKKPKGKGAASLVETVENADTIDDAVARMMEHRPDDPGVREKKPEEDKKRFRLF